MMNDRITAFIDDLSRMKLPGNACNQYSYAGNRNEIRRNNLRLYLGQMAKHRPRVMLVGEAPGYLGCRLTGVPFASEFILHNGLEELGMFGTGRGYEVTAEYGRIRKEQSATIVWGALTRTRMVPLLWNAFPFHPHKAGEPRSNRTPTSGELAVGTSFVRRLAELFEIQTVVALGNKAEASLRSLDMDYLKIRHPAQGGKREFDEGINALALSLRTE